MALVHTQNLKVANDYDDIIIIPSVALYTNDLNSEFESVIAVSHSHPQLPVWKHPSLAV